MRLAHRTAAVSQPLAPSAVPRRLVLLLREKKAGHINQVEGVGELLGELGPCEMRRVGVRPKWWAHSAVRQLFLARTPLDQPKVMRRAIRRVYGFEANDLAADVFVGSGRPTIALGIWLAHYHRGLHIFSGHAKGPRTETIDLQLINNPRLAGDAAYALTPVPGIIDGASYREPRPIRCRHHLTGAHLGLAIGGDSHSHRFAKKDWDGLVRFIRCMRSEYGVRWVVSNSRRSPTELGGVLRGLEQEGVIEEFVDFKDRGIGTAGAVFAADVVIVTEDSLSMLSEGLAAGRPVVALRPKRSEHCEMSEVVAYQAGQGWLASVPMATIEPETFLRELLALKLPAWTARGLIKQKIADCLALADIRYAVQPP